MNKVRKPGPLITRLCHAWWGPPGVHTRLQRLDLLPVPDRAVDPNYRARLEKIRASNLARMVPCKRCTEKRALPPNLYCLPCDRHFRYEMRRSGYLKPPPPETRRRRREETEDIYETRQGLDR